MPDRISAIFDPQRALARTRVPQSFVAPRRAVVQAQSNINDLESPAAKAARLPVDIAEGQAFEEAMRGLDAQEASLRYQAEQADLDRQLKERALNEQKAAEKSSGRRALLGLAGAILPTVASAFTGGSGGILSRLFSGGLAAGAVRSASPLLNLSNVPGAPPVFGGGRYNG